MVARNVVVSPGCINSVLISVRFRAPPSPVFAPSVEILDSDIEAFGGGGEDEVVLLKVGVHYLEVMLSTINLSQRLRP